MILYKCGDITLEYDEYGYAVFQRIYYGSSHISIKEWKQLTPYYKYRGCAVKAYNKIIKGETK